MSKYPIERKFTLLRQCFFEPALYEQRHEVWWQTGPQPEDGSLSPRKLISSEPTGRKFKVTRKVSPEAIEDAPEMYGQKPHEVVQCVDPSFTLITFLEQVEGDALEGGAEDMALAKSLEELKVSDPTGAEVED